MTTRWQHYQICKERGHQASIYTLTVDPPLSVCRHCGTQYRNRIVLEEYNVPKEDE